MNGCVTLAKVFYMLNQVREIEVTVPSSRLLGEALDIIKERLADVDREIPMRISFVYLGLYLSSTGEFIYKYEGRY